MSEQQMLSSIHNFLRTPANPTPVGEVRPFFDSRTATLERLECHATTLNAGQAPHPPHRHPEEELILVREGTLEANLNGVKHELPAGSVFFIAPQDLHGLKNVGTTRATYFVVRIWSAATGGE